MDPSSQPPERQLSDDELAAADSSVEEDKPPKDRFGRPIYFDGWSLEEFRYEQGGHYPMHLGDVLEARYRVIHKLGYGGFGNVWLCRDLSSGDDYTYVALKVLTADVPPEDCRESHFLVLLRRRLDPAVLEELFCPPLAQFHLTSPNGTHICFAYPVMRPSVDQEPEGNLNMDAIMRERCQNIVRAIAALHDDGISYGDFRPKNILLRGFTFDGLPEEDLLAALETLRK